MIAVVGFLATIAIPAYQNYKVRAAAQQELGYQTAPETPGDTAQE